MARVSINRNDKLPDVCIRCGEPQYISLRIRIAKREKGNSAGLMTGLDVLRLLITLIPTIGWSLPFCIDHSWSTKMKNKTQILLLVATLFMLGSGGWWFAAGHQGWVFGAAVIAAPLLLLAADHFELRPTYVSSDRLALDAAHERFIEEFEALNQLTDEVEQDSDPALNQSTGY